MSLWRTLRNNCGRLQRNNLQGFWGIDIDTKDPAIPNLPLITAPGVLKCWTGTAWVKEPIKTWLAGSWQSKPLKRWTGTEWVQVDTTGI